MEKGAKIDHTKKLARKPLKRIGGGLSMPREQLLPILKHYKQAIE
jgi:hypothetical protein